MRSMPAFLIATNRQNYSNFDIVRYFSQYKACYHHLRLLKIGNKMIDEFLLFEHNRMNIEQGRRSLL